MNRFSTPEEIFGPVSIKELKTDKYTRKTKGYLPKSDFAFLDEIWKSSPAILNTLLTLINERIFRNGEKTEKAPLKALISASNETPPNNQGLEALYDRFLVRLFVPPMLERDNFESLLRTKPTEAIIDIKQELKIDEEEWSQWQQGIHSVSLSEEVITIINLIKNNLNNLDKEHAVYVSDRRWQRAALLLKTSAFLCDRLTTNLSDALLLRHCLWAITENREEIIKIVEEAVQKSGLPTGVDIADLDKEKEKLDQDIIREFYHSEDVYDFCKLGDGEYFKIKPEELNMDYNAGPFFIPAEHMNTSDDFNPVDEQGNEIENVTYNFNGQGTCTIGDYDRYSRKNTYEYTPNILYHKGTKKTDVHEITSKGFSETVSENKQKYKTALEKILSCKDQVEKGLDIPFVPKNTREIAYKAITDQIDQLNARIQDCDRLSKLIDPEIKT